MPSSLYLPFLKNSDDFPNPSLAWDEESPAPGLLAKGADLCVPTLQRAYSQGIFPWYSEDSPILWWSPDPRMVLYVDEFRLHASLKKTIKRFMRTPGCEVRFDTDFAQVIHRCAHVRRDGQAGTWIVPEMQTAYIALHRAGHAHSIETWMNDQLVGGLYCTSFGKAIFGESMFTLSTDASKIALAALIAFCRFYQVNLIDCQQNTRHLLNFGGRTITRNLFLKEVVQNVAFQDLEWHFNFLYWSQLFEQSF